MNVCDRQAFQAWVAVLAAGVVGFALNLSHAYWVTITAGVMIMPSWGQGLEKGLQRIGGTVAGCTLGLFVAWLLPETRGEAALALLVFAIAMYHFGANYTLMMFWISFFLMLVFSLVGELNADSFLARLLDTAIGAGIASLVSVSVLPTHSRNRFRETAAQYFHELRDYFDASICMGLLDTEPERLPWPASLDETKRPEPYAKLDELPERRHQLIKLLQSLREAHRISLYEGIFVRYSRKRSQAIMDDMQSLSHFVTDFTFAVAEGTLRKPAAPYRDDLRRIRDYAIACFNHVHGVAEHRDDPSPVDDTDMDELRRDIRKRLIERLRGGDINPEQVMQLVVAVGFIWQMLDTLDDLAETLEGS